MKSKAKKALPEINRASILTREAINFKQGYLFEGDMLRPLSPDHAGFKPPVERKFKSAKELAQLLVKNSKMLFGNSCYIIAVPPKKEEKGYDQSTPDFCLLDLSDLINPKVYFIDLILSKSDIFGNMFYRVTKFFLNEKENMETMIKLYQRNVGIMNVLRSRGKLDKEGILSFFMGLSLIKPTTLLITNGEAVSILTELGLVYPLWRNVKPMVMKKYGSNGSTVCTMTPVFAEIHLTARQKVKGAPVKEEEHFKDVLPEVKEMFYRIKTELMKVNTQLSWNSQKFYIALKNSRKIAVFQFSRKKMTIVVMNPEKDTRANIKHYEIKTLTEKVQRFWNGACSTVVIDKAGNLDEVIKLLKKLIKD